MRFPLDRFCIEVYFGCNNETDQIWYAEVSRCMVSICQKGYMYPELFVSFCGFGWLCLKGYVFWFEEEKAVTFPVTGTDRCVYLLSSVTIVMLLAVTAKFS